MGKNYMNAKTSFCTLPTWIIQKQMPLHKPLVMSQLFSLGSPSPWGAQSGQLPNINVLIRKRWMQANDLRQHTCIFIHSGAGLWSICLYDPCWAGRPCSEELRWIETKIPTEWAPCSNCLELTQNKGTPTRPVLRAHNTCKQSTKIHLYNN